MNHNTSNNNLVIKSFERRQSEVIIYHSSLLLEEIAKFPQKSLTSDEIRFSGRIENNLNDLKKIVFDKFMRV